MYKDILLPIDLNEESAWDKALPVALEYCRAFGAKLHVMTVVPNFGMSLVGSYFPEGFENKQREETERQLKEFVATKVPDQIGASAIVAEGTAYEEIIKTAEGLDVDLIVMASHRPALRDFLLGPNAERVVRHSSCSVLVVRP